LLFRKASPESETRILTAIGIGVVTCLVVVAVVAFANPFASRSDGTIGIVIETPYGGQGVKAGTALVMHGIQVGEVTNVTNLPGGKVRYAADLRPGPTSGLTTSMGIDFRPANYFGVTGINLRPGDGGQALTNGVLVKTTPAGNFTLQAMLSRLGEISHGVITPRLIEVIQKATTYTDSLDPLVETLFVVTNALTDVQTVSTARLLTNATGLSVAFPGFVYGAALAGDGLRKPLDGFTYEWWNLILGPTLVGVSDHFFGAIGKLLTSHSTELVVATDLIKLLTDVVPGVVPPDAIADTARELRMRMERLYSGPPDRRAVNVRVVLDSLPGVAAPIAAMGGTP
jgi:hypothetical protein